MRRYWLTFFLLLGLLLVGGLAVVNILNAPDLVRGGYVPTLSSDPQTATVEATIFVVSITVVLGMTVGLGIFLAITFIRLNALIVSHWGEIIAPARSAGTKPAAGDQGLPVPLSGNRSLAIFWVALVLIVVVLQVLRYWGDPRPFGYLPGLSDLASMPVFKLPGEHINGLPAFIAGPGDTVTGVQLMVLAVALTLGGAAVVGAGMAQGLARLDKTVATADKLKPTLPDRLIPMVEHQIQQLRAPRPKRLPGNPIDGMLIGVNAVLALVILGIVAFYIVPSFSGVAAIDKAVEATKIAALVTATPEPTAGANELDLLKQAVAALPPGTAANGDAIYRGKGGCVACHSLEPGKDGVGPTWAGLAARAATRRPDYSAEVYLYESITHPNAFVVPGFQPSIMPQTFIQTLSKQEIADVIAFLLTQK